MAAVNSSRALQSLCTSNTCSGTDCSPDMNLISSISLIADENVKQPCPDSALPLFPSFSKLPTEIRLQIWTFAAYFPRVVKIKSMAGVHCDSYECLDYDFYANEAEGIRAYCKVPEVLTVNRESREVGLKAYELGLDIHGSAVHTFINWSVDTIFMSVELYYQIYPSSLHYLHRLLGHEQCGKFQQLALSEAIFKSNQGLSRQHIINAIRSLFNNLKVLVVVQPPGDSYYSVSKNIHISAQIIQSVKDEKFNFPEWEVPEVVFTELDN